MTAPVVEHARRVIARYDAGVYRFDNDRGLSVAAVRGDDGHPVGTWTVVPVVFSGPGAEDFAVVRRPDGLMDLHLGLDDAALAALAAEVRQMEAP